VVSSGGSFIYVVTGQKTYPVASLTLDSARSYVMQGASFIQGMISNTPIGGSISPEGFVPSILLLVVIIVTVVIVVVILVVVVVAIVKVVIVVAIVRVVVVVVGGVVSSILKLSFMIIGFLRRIVFYYLLHQSLGYGNSFFQVQMIRLAFSIPIGWAYTFHQDKALSVKDTIEILEFKTSKDRYGDNRMSDSIGGLVFLVTKVGENRMSSGGVIDLTSDEDPTDEDGDTRMDDSIGVSASLVGEAIGACSGGIGNSLVASYACMTSIYGSSCKGEKTSVAKIYVVKSFEESGEVFSGEDGK
nr:hypothetical protein [Tanacetum cinerariifolium]